MIIPSSRWGPYRRSLSPGVVEWDRTHFQRYVPLHLVFRTSDGLVGFHCVYFECFVHTDSLHQETGTGSQDLVTTSK